MAKSQRSRVELEDHIQIAEDLSIAIRHLTKAFRRCRDKFPKSHPAYRAIRKVDPRTPGGFISELCHQLDEDFHRAVDDEQREALGNIYHGHESDF